MKYIKTEDNILKALKELNDIVVPTMGSKGMLAGISEEMDKPTLTDDGVTVIKQCRRLDDGWGRMIAAGVIEAAHNTEKVAYDGTTLTVLLTYEFYKAGYEAIKKGEHPQLVASKIALEVESLVKSINEYKTIKISSKHEVEQVATISTKIPSLGDMIGKAYLVAGNAMNILVEHDREHNGLTIEHSDGYSIDSGYFSDVMKAFCNVEGDVTEFENARVALLKEGIMSPTMIGDFFGSIPKEELKIPIVFLVDSTFNPEALRIIIETVVSNDLICQFVFINETKPDDLYLDLAAITDGTVQDAAGGIKKYVYSMCGTTKKIRIEKDKCIIEGVGNVKPRLKAYTKRLTDNKFSMSETEHIITEKRMSSLTNGVTKLKVGVSTITEFKTLKLKLDDGIGAVRKSLEEGVVIGGGKCLYNYKNYYNYIGTALAQPLLTICNNGGIDRKTLKKLDKINKDVMGIDVNNNTIVNLQEVGILDSKASVIEALKNASSIACNYLRTYILIKERD